MTQVAMRRKPNNNAPAPQFRNPTAASKITNVTTKFGAPGIKNNQGSTRIVYDYLELGEGAQAKTTFTYFLEAQTRKFPFTNLTDGKLQVGEALAIQRMYWTIMTITDATNEVVTVESLDEAMGAGDGIYASTFNIMITNSQVVKPTPISSFRNAFNRYAPFDNYNVFHFDNNIVIPSLFEFEVNLVMPILVNPTSGTLTFHLGCYIEGLGSIMAPRTTY
jgi:hypothetical protein